MGPARKFNVQTFFANSDLGIRAALLAGRLLPPHLGYPLVQRVADRIAMQTNWAMVRGARVNQWVVSGQQLSGEDLTCAVRETVRNQARALYDYYHYWNVPPDQQKLIIFDPMIEKLIARSHLLDSDQGVIVVGLHLSNFDFGMLNAFRKGLRALIITLTDLPGGYRRQFDLRRSSGMEIVTASIPTFRRAIARLQAGDVVLTGLEHPFPDLKYRPCFFGQPASIPVHYVQMALKARVPVVLGAIELQADHNYHFLLSDPISMQTYSDHHTEILRNAEAVLAVAEGFIRKAPRQWAMFHPIWPDLMDQMP